MARPKKNSKSTKTQNLKFHLDFLNSAQGMAHAAYAKHDITFLLGPAGVGKTHLAMAFAIWDILRPNSNKKKIIMTRPIVEAGENLGFLPGELEDKVDPYMRPLADCLARLVKDPLQREKIQNSIEVAPLAYLRGRTFIDSICILDEAQNTTKKQLKMFLTRFDGNSKIIITGDPGQSDLKQKDVPLVDCMSRLETVPGIGIIQFKEDSIVRHPLVIEITKRLNDW